jgi:hypothetical protein
MGKKGYLKCIGGKGLLTIVLKGSSIEDKVIENFNKQNNIKEEEMIKSKKVSPYLIREECDKILIQFSDKTMEKRMDNIFWPFLLETFDQVEYSSGFSLICIFIFF